MFALVLFLSAACQNHSQPTTGPSGPRFNLPAPEVQRVDVLGEVAFIVHNTENRPVVLFDLDDTLFDVASRNLRILRELALEPEMKKAYPGLSEKLSGTLASSIAYDFGDTLNSLGVSDAAVIEKARTYWSERFFSDAYCQDDTPISGASSYVNSLHRSGAFIVYLTGRDVPRMEAGTRRSLELHGFPMGERTELILKPTADLDDTVFKKGVFEHVKTIGKLVAAFENEPRNINAMHDAFPGAYMVFLETRHSKKPDVPYDTIARIKDYARQ